MSHVRPAEPGRRMRFVVICGGILAIVAGLGVGYAALGGSDRTVAAGAPGAAATTAPAENLLDLEPALPDAEPVVGAATDPAPAATTKPAAIRTTTPAGGTQTRPDETPDAPVAPQPAEPVATIEPTQAAPTSITQPAVPAVPLPLTATFTFDAVEGADGWTGYTGRVRVSNPGERASGDWTVTLSVPGGNAVTASGAGVSQDGEAVTFTGPAIGAGESASFSFSVEGTLVDLPGGCRVDGAACS